MYVDTLKSPRDTIKEKQGGLLSRSVMLLHDSAPVRKAKKVQGAVIGADIHRAMVATAQKELLIGRRPERNWTQLHFFLCFTSNQ